MLWTGTSKTATDLQPTNIQTIDSRAVAIATVGIQTLIGGYGTDPSSFFQHALIWTNKSANSAIDLNPPGYMDSEVTDVNANVAVGFGRVDGDFNDIHALAWYGSGSNFVDLNRYLPAGFTSAQAFGIDANGDIVGQEVNPTTGVEHAVEWTPVPEPTGLTALGGLALAMLSRRRKRRQPAETILTS
jgi:hypothetical protein